MEEYEDIEEEEEDGSSALMEKPFDPTKINIETKTPSLDTLIKRIERKEIQMDTSTYFQRRDDLWKAENQSRLIESILIRFPLPAFFFDASEDNNWLVVDGLQRLSSIRNFCIDETLKLTGLEFLKHLEGKNWKDLSGDLRRVIEETQVVVNKIMPGTPTDVKFNIFKRINTGGLILQPQEIRHALYQGKPAKFIAELAKNKAFLEATEKRIKPDRMLDRDFANRFLAFYLFGYQNYSESLDTFMSRAMASINTKTETELDEITKDFEESMKLSKAIFGNEAFRKICKRPYEARPPINKALFDAIATQFAVLSPEKREALQEKGSPFKEAVYISLKEDNEFYLSVTSATGGKNRVIYRHEKIKKLIEQTINPQIQC